MTKPRVFIPFNSNKFDFSDAMRFGDLVFLLNGPYPMNPDLAMKRIFKKLTDENYDKDVDYLCLTGNTILVACMTSTAILMRKQCKVLLFDAVKSAYRPSFIQSPLEELNV